MKSAYETLLPTHAGLARVVNANIFTIYCRYDKYKWVAKCPDAGKEFKMSYPHGSARQAADDVARQITGFPKPKLVRVSSKIYALVLPDIPIA
jgi:hypothetical protein